MRKVINPSTIAAPASAYNHALLVGTPVRELYLSGQVGERPDGSIADDIVEQARQAWSNVKAILSDADMNAADIVKITTYLVGRENVVPYVTVQRQEVGEHLPPWTLVLVAGLGRSVYLVEIEVTAVAPEAPHDPP